MGTITKNNLNKIKKWYKEGYSVREIGEKLGVSIHAVYYFFRRHNIERRTYSEVNKVLFKRKPLSFKMRKNLSYKEKLLKVTGLMLYWAEGTERGHTVDLANSNGAMILLFLKFLREICQVDEKRLRMFLYCYSNQNKDNLIKHWSRVTKIPVSQFSKPYIRRDYKMKFGREMKYGLAHVRYNDKKLLYYLIEEKQKFLEYNKLSDE